MHPQDRFPFANRLRHRDWRQDRRSHALDRVDEDQGPGGPGYGPGRDSDDYFRLAARERPRRRVGGPHRGRGPRGWTRSDDRIREDVNEALTRDPYVDATDVEVTVRDGEVTLGGRVATRSQKRHAERCAERVEGVNQVFNQIRLPERRA